MLRPFCPDLADVFVGCEAAQGLEAFGEVVGHEKGMEMLFELAVRLVMVALHRRFFERSVHPLDLTVRPGVIGLGEPGARSCWSRK